jgi:hypothetical protein
MTLSRSSHGRLQAWAVRAVAAFLVVYMLGAFGVPTLIPYLAAIIAVAIDAVRVVRRGPERPRNYRTTDRGETIH